MMTITKQEFLDAIGPVVNPLDFSAWHAAPNGKACQLGVHVCTKGEKDVRYVFRAITVSHEQLARLQDGDEIEIEKFMVAYNKVKTIVYDTVIEVHGSLDGIDLVATMEGYTGLLS